MDDLTENTGISAPTQPELATPPKTLTQDEVNRAVVAAKHRAVEATKRELEAQHQAEIARLKGELGGSQPNVEEIEMRVYNKFLSDLKSQKEAVDKETQERELKEIANQYYLKMGKGSELFDDFKDVLSDFEPQAFPNTVMLATQAEKTPEIMYELARNPSKLVEIENLIRNGAEKLAEKELEKLSHSISKNIEAKNQAQNIPPPLSKVKSSSVGMEPSGPTTISALRKQPWMKA